jgi:hypothetical protein
MSGRVDRDSGPDPEDIPDRHLWASRRFAPIDLNLVGTPDHSLLNFSMNQKPTLLWGKLSSVQKSCLLIKSVFSLFFFFLFIVLVAD